MADELLTSPEPNGATVMWLHAGALMVGSPADHVRHGVRRYVDVGYTVLCLDYPLVPPASLDEIVAYTTEACSRIESPFAIVGHSAGGYLALAATAELDRKPDAIVSFYGYGSLRWGLEPAYLHLPAANPEQGGAQRYVWCRQNGRWLHEVTGRDPIHDSKWIERYEPVLRPADGVPTLLLHGDADIDVPVDESRKMAAALASAGIDHSYVEIPGGGHGFDVAEPDVALEPVLEFLKHRLG
jgi:acetyl esterase/lipase